MTGRYEVLVVLEGENTAVFQYVRNIKQVDVIVPLADAVGPVIHVIDEIHMQGVPLAVFPIAHTPLGLDTRHEVVVTVRNDFGGKSAVGQLLDQFTVLVIDLAAGGQQQHSAFLKRLDGVDRFIVLTR